MVGHFFLDSYGNTSVSEQKCTIFCCSVFVFNSYLVKKYDVFR